MQNLGFKTNTIVRALEIANDNPDGFTVSNDMSEMPERGYAVALAATQGSFGLPGFLRALAMAVDENLYFGGWLNKEDGQYYWDAVRLFPQGQLQAADKFAQEQGQIALFNLDEGIVMNVPINGDRIIIDSVFPEEPEEIAYSQYSVGDKLVVAGNESGHHIEFGTEVVVLEVDSLLEKAFYKVRSAYLPDGETWVMLGCDLDFADTDDDDVTTVGSSPESIADLMDAADEYEYRFHTWREGNELFVIQNTCEHELPIGSKVVVLNPTTFNNESFYDVNFVGGEKGDWYQIHQDDLGE